ncbi:MAG: hypothetical protein ABMA64_13255 [Myxococcota bacterium]
MRATLRFLGFMAGVSVPAVAVASWPIGSKIDGSVLVDVTPGGFAALESLAATFIPPEIPVTDVALADDSCNILFCTYEYAIGITGLAVTLGIDDLSITPGEQVLNLDGTIAVQAGTPAAPAIVDIDAVLLGLIDISDTCALYSDPIHVTIDGAILMQLNPDPAGVDVDGDGNPDTKALDAEVPPIAWTWDATDESIHFTDCGTADVINGLNTVLDFFGLNIYDIVLDQITPQIDAVVNELPAQLEPTLEEAFGSAVIAQSIDLLGVPLDFVLWPDTLDLKVEGMRIGMASVTDTAVSPCVAQWDSGGSTSTPSLQPEIGEPGAGVSFSPHADAFIDDDFLNQVLYGVWAGGLLCYDLDSATAADLGVPLPIDTSLLTILAPNVYTSMFPTVAPMSIRTQPRAAPTIGQGSHQVNVVADQLGLGFIAEVDHRRTRLFNVDLTANVGIDTTFDNTTGRLGLAIDATDITPIVSYNEFKPDDSGTIQTSFGGLLSGLVGSLLGDALSGTGFNIPGFEGVGITQLQAGAGGPDGDYVGAWLLAGPVTYPSTSCSGSSGGCGCSGSSGCGSSSGCGCDTGNPAVVFALPVVIALLRRRR